jgi:hypothetical protein
VDPRLCRDCRIFTAECAENAEKTAEREKCKIKIVGLSVQSQLRSAAAFCERTRSRFYTLIECQFLAFVLCGFLCVLCALCGESSSSRSFAHRLANSFCSFSAVKALRAEAWTSARQFLLLILGGFARLLRLLCGAANLLAPRSCSTLPLSDDCGPILRVEVMRPGAGDVPRFLPDALPRAPSSPLDDPSRANTATIASIEFPTPELVAPP